MSMTTVVTKYGPLDLHPVELDRVRVEVGIPLNVDGRSFDLNGVPHAVQAWLSRWSDGAWHLGNEDDRMSQLHEPNLTRRDRYGGGELKDPSRSAYEKARPAIETAVNEWAATDAGRLALAEANERTLLKRYERAQEKETEASEALRIAELATEEAEGEHARAYRDLTHLKRELESGDG